MQVAFRPWAVAAMMLSPIEILYLCLSSAEAFAMSAVTGTVLKSLSRSVVLS